MRGMFFYALLFSAIVSIIDARVLNVPIDYSSIRKGIESALTGDTVLVAPGKYYEGIDFNGKKITVASHFILSGDTSYIKKTIICDNLVPPDQCQFYSSDQHNSVLFDSTENSESILTGFTILDEYVSVSNRSNPKIQQIIVCGTKSTGYHPHRYSEMSVSSSEFSTVTGITFINTLLYLNGSMVTVRGNVFQNTVVEQFRNKSKNIIDNNHFFNSSIDLAATGTYSDSIEILNNSFIDCSMSFGGTGDAHHYTKIYNNTFLRDTSSYSGISFIGTGNCIVNANITGNTFFGNNIEIGGTGNYFVNATINKNIFAQSTDTAIMFDPISLASYSCKFINNTVVGNELGIEVKDSAGNLDIINCIFWGNGVDLDRVQNSQISYSLFNTPFSSNQNGNMAGDPLLIDITKYEFGLQRQSPCINQGDPSQPFDPDGTRSDIGAIPFNNSFVPSIFANFEKISSKPIAFLHEDVLSVHQLSHTTTVTKIFIYDIKGRLVLKNILQPNVRSVDLKTVPLCPGSYILRVTRDTSFISFVYLKR